MNVRTNQLPTAVAFAAISCATVLAADLNVSITGDGSANVIAGACNAAIEYEVSGLLSDDVSEGLAGFSFDLAFSGGPMERVDAPWSPVMFGFDRPLGMTGPYGFRGHIVDGRLVGVGGAQNTVKNVTPPYPLGEVSTGVGHTETVLVTGSLTVPDSPGIYTLRISNVRATVIRPGEDGSGDFWAVEPVTSVTTSDLTIEVLPPDMPAAAFNSGPVCTEDAVYLYGDPAGAVEYRWTGPSGFTSTQQDPVVSPPMEGTYRLTVIDLMNCASTAYTQVTLLTQACEPYVDCNANGAHDTCDLALGESLDCNFNAIPDDCDVPGDANGDGLLNLPDLPLWVGCMTGPCGAPPCDPPLYADACCAWVDLDNDGDVDLSEFGGFQRLIGSE